MSAMAAVDPPLIVPVEDLAERLGVELTDTNRGILTDALLDAQSDVEAYLGRPLTPMQYVEQHLWPTGETWSLTAAGDDPVVQVISAVPEVYDDGSPTGHFTVTYTAGLDAATAPELRPIRRYVLVHAINSPEILRYWKKATGAKGDIRSVSAEGQSVSWSEPTLGAPPIGARGAGAPMLASMAPGALPSLASLDRWRVAGRRVYQAPTRASVWPGQSMDYPRGGPENRDWFER